ncbi:MAG: hypothetical protein ACLQAT_13880 [Candidatus Binataceae bacterium]
MTLRQLLVIDRSKGRGATVEETIVRAIGTGTAMGAMWPIAVASIHHGGLFGYGTAMFLLFLGFFGGQVAGGIVYQRWIGTTREPEPKERARPIFVKLMALFVLTMAIALLAELIFKRFTPINTGLAMTAMAASFAVTAIRKQSRYFRLMSTTFFLLGTVALMLSGGHLTLGPAWICLIAAGVALLIHNDPAPQPNLGAAHTALQS